MTQHRETSFCDWAGRRACMRALRQDPRVHNIAPSDRTDSVYGVRYLLTWDEAERCCASCGRADAAGAIIQTKVVGRRTDCLCEECA